jgi:hypothetical protein
MATTFPSMVSQLRKLPASAWIYYLLTDAAATSLPTCHRYAWKSPCEQHSYPPSQHPFSLPENEGLTMDTWTFHRCEVLLQEQKLCLPAADMSHSAAWLCVTVSSTCELHSTGKVLRVQCALTNGVRCFIIVTKSQWVRF